MSVQEDVLAEIGFTRPVFSTAMHCQQQEHICSSQVLLFVSCLTLASMLPSFPCVPLALVLPELIGLLCAGPPGALAQKEPRDCPCT